MQNPITTLKSDLERAIRKREQAREELSKYLQLRDTINMIKDKKMKKLKTKVDIGCQFYMQAETTDIEKMVVKIGTNIFVELSLDEALKFISKKEQIFNSMNSNLARTIEM